MELVIVVWKGNVMTFGWWVCVVERNVEYCADGVGVAV